MTYLSVEHYYAPAEVEESSRESFSARVAEVLAVFALVFFVTGFIGFFGMQNSPRPNSIYSDLLDVSLIATAASFVASIVLIVAQRLRAR